MPCVEDDFQRIGSLAEVPEGELRAFDLPGVRVAIAHVENELFAFGDECTHEGCSLAEGRLGEKEETVVCPCLERLDAEFGTQGRRFFDAAVPPAAYAYIVRRIGEAGLQQDAKIVFEK